MKELLREEEKTEEPRCGHFEGCSPLSVYAYPLQVRAKRAHLEELIGPLDYFSSATALWGYRKKIEFSFYGDDEGLSLAFFAPGGRGRKVKAKEGCALASRKMNELAFRVASLLESRGIRAGALKSLVTLESKSEDARIALLFVKSEEGEYPTPSLEELPEGTVGFHLIYSDRRSPAAVITKHMYGCGAWNLEEKVLGATLTYPADGFFQNNVAVFEELLTHASKYITGERLVDLYCGVGTVGIALSKTMEHPLPIVALESHEAMVTLARENAKENGIEEYEAEALAIENHPHSFIKESDCVVLDPPRAGLHKKVVAALLEAKPKRILYISCNAQTQAQDIELLESGYKIEYRAGFDMYPHTLHLESLVVLTRI